MQLTPLLTILLEMKLVSLYLHLSVFIHSLSFASIHTLCSYQSARLFIGITTLIGSGSVSTQQSNEALVISVCYASVDHELWLMNSSQLTHRHHGSKTASHSTHKGQSSENFDVPAAVLVPLFPICTRLFARVLLISSYRSSSIRFKDSCIMLCIVSWGGHLRARFCRAVEFRNIVIILSGFKRWTWGLRNAAMFHLILFPLLILVTLATSQQIWDIVRHPSSRIWMIIADITLQLVANDLG